MSASKSQQPSRQHLVAKIHKALRSHYKPIAPNTTRPLLEQVLYACCLENAPYDVAERSLGSLLKGYYDLNEVRVTTVVELAELLPDLPDPARAALSLRRVLQSVFESSYAFTLENAKKHSIAHGIRTLEHLHGATPFVVAFIASTALGGHFIPLDQGALSALYLAGIISREEYDSGRVSGIERFIPKKAGLEFGSLLHQFGVEVQRNLHGATVKKVLQAVNPAAAKERFPKRGEPLPLPNPPAPAGKQAQKAADAARSAAEEHRPAGPQAAARPAGKTPLPPPGAGPKRTADGKLVPGAKPGPKPFVVKPNVGKPITIKPQAQSAPPPKAESKKIPPAKKPTKAAAANQGKDRTPAGKQAAKKAGAGKAGAKSRVGQRHSAQLVRRKPR